MDVAYVSLYMDAAESFEYAEMQVDGAIRQILQEGGDLSTTAVLCDVVATPEQIRGGAATNVARHILAYVDQNYPTLKTRIVGITDDDNRRLIRDLVLTGRLKKTDIDGVHLLELE